MVAAIGSMYYRKMSRSIWPDITDFVIFVDALGNEITILTHFRVEKNV